MKKTLIVGLLLAMGVSTLQAGETKFTGGIGLAGAVPVDGFGSAYSSGFGIDGNIGLTFDENLAVLLAIDSIVFPTDMTDVRSIEVNFIPSLRYAFGSGNARPYLIGGAGVNTNYLQIGGFSGSESNFAFSLGGGVLFDLSQAIDLYAQVRFTDVIVDGGSFSYLPIAVGVQFK